MISHRILAASIALLLAGAAHLAAFDFQLHGERISLRADHTPLRDVLMAFAHAGVLVRMDPSINSTVSGVVTNENLEAVFDIILAPYGYALIWDVIEGPLGSLPKLVEIQVFRQDTEKILVPLYEPGANLQVTHGLDIDGPAFVKDEILLALKPGTSLEELRLLLAQIGGTVIDCLPELGIYRVRFMPGVNIQALIKQLQQNEMVHTVEPNYVVEAPAPGFTGATDTGTKTANFSTPVDGTPSLAILDSGLGSFEGLDDMIVGRLDALNPDRELTDPLGHGTQMALIAAGAIVPGGAGEDAAGVPLVAIRAFDDNGRASNFGLMRSIEYALSQGTRTMNMSWGSETSSSFLANAIAYARSKKMLVVAAAGNEPTGKPLYPAAYPWVLAVGAANADGSFWKKSNYGDFITLSAPGSASFPIGYRGPPGTYMGTSISSVYTARTLARYFAKHPHASTKQAVHALLKALSDKGQKGKDQQYGHGLLDAAALKRFLATE